MPDTPEIPKAIPHAYVAIPFVNTAKIGSLEWMRAGLPGALVEKLEAHPALRPAYGPMLLSPGPPPETIDAVHVAEVAARMGARYVWTGAFARPEWRLEITLRLWEVAPGVEAATLVGEATERGDFARVFELLDALALRLLDEANLAPPPVAVARIKRPPTRDFYAFTLWGRALAALHGLGKPPNLAKAEKDASRAAFIDPKYAEAHRLLAVVYDEKGLFAKAKGRRTWALDLRPDYYAPLAGLVRAAYAAKERGDAVALARRALAIRPWDLDIRFLLAEMAWDEGDVDRAYLELKRLVAVRPDHLPTRRLLVLCHATKGASEELAAELEAILRLSPDDEAARLDLGAAYASLGRDADAIRTYEEVAERNPKQILALKFLGDLYKQKGDLGTAISYYERALLANRNDPRPYFLLGAAYVEAGEDAKAIRIYTLAQRFPRYVAEVYNNLGAIYLRRGEPGQALWYFKRAVGKRPQNARARYNYGLALSKLHRRDESVKELTLASELDPTDAEIHFALGVVLLEMGRVEEAEQAFQEVLRLDPKHEDAEHNLRLIDELRRRAREGEIQVE